MSTIGELIDKLYLLRQQRLLVEKDVEALKAEESALQTFLIEELKEQKLEFAAGSKARFGVKQAKEPTVKNWDKLYDFIYGDKAWAVLQRRVSSATWKEYLDSGILLPGTEKFEVTKVSITKVR